jgi:hypothetical protein
VVRIKSQQIKRSEEQARKPEPTDRHFGIDLKNPFTMSNIKYRRRIAGSLSLRPETVGAGPPK